jgi:putative sugar O-methyltransferase
MEINGGKYRPGERWQMESLFEESPEKQSNPEFDDMLSPWVGIKAKQAVSEEVFEKYRDFLEDYDHLDLLSAYFPSLEFSKDSQLMVCDLGTIMDMNLITKHLQSWDGENLYVLEVGGGYGRLAEAFLGVFEDQVKYVLVDAVPASLHYSYKYLNLNFPERSIGFYYCDDIMDLSKYDCYIVPAWHFEKINNQVYDISVNVASLQEIEDQQVSYYLELFNRLTKLDGMIYLSNSRDFYYQRDYKYPENWRLVARMKTPRSWTPHYPVEIFIKTDKDCSSENVIENAISDNVYLKGVCVDYRENIQQLNDVIKKIQERNKTLRENYGRIKERLELVNEDRALLRQRIDKMNEDRSLLMQRLNRLSAIKRIFKKRGIH